MPWLKSHSELRNHPKVAKAARLLGVSMPQVIGHLHMLWWWAMDYAPSGNLSDFVAEDIAIGAGWEGDPEVFLDALLESGMGSKSGFLERTPEGLAIHDWDDHGGRDVEVRRANQERMRRSRRDTKDCDGCGEIEERSPERCANPETKNANDTGSVCEAFENGLRTLRARGERGERKERKEKESPPTPPSGGDCRDSTPEVVGGPKTSSGRKIPPQSPTPEFVRFWEAYPRKVAKDAAWQIWCRLLRGNFGPPPRSPDDLVAAAAKYADECRAACREQDKILHARTFLGPQRRWTDYVRAPDADRSGGEPCGNGQAPLPEGGDVVDYRERIRLAQLREGRR